MTMIFTSRFGALAARPNFRDPKLQTESELQREIDELLEAAELEQPTDERAS
jgi:hypothetical protein